MTARRNDFQTLLLLAFMALLFLFGTVPGGLVIYAVRTIFEF